MPGETYNGEINVRVVMDAPPAGAPQIPGGGGEPPSEPTAGRMPRPPTAGPYLAPEEREKLEAIREERKWQREAKELQTGAAEQQKSFNVEALAKYGIIASGITLLVKNSAIANAFLQSQMSLLGAFATVVLAPLAPAIGPIVELETKVIGATQEVIREGGNLIQDAIEGVKDIFKKTWREAQYPRTGPYRSAAGKEIFMQEAAEVAGVSYPTEYTPSSPDFLAQTARGGLGFQQGLESKFPNLISVIDTLGRGLLGSLFLPSLRDAFAMNEAIFTRVIQAREKPSEVRNTFNIEVKDTFSTIEEIRAQRRRLLEDETYNTRWNKLWMTP